MKTFQLDYTEEFFESIALETGWNSAMADSHDVLDEDGVVIETIPGVTAEDYVTVHLYRTLQREIKSILEKKYNREKETVVGALAVEKQVEIQEKIQADLTTFGNGLNEV